MTPAREHTDQRARAQAFLEMHGRGRILVLPNAWDAASARIFAACGAEAVGTTSMGVAATAGLPDVERIGLKAMLGAVSTIAGAVHVPVSADMERGYGERPEDVAASIGAALDRGAVGVNVEDGSGDADDPLIDPRAMVERIAAIRSMADGRGIPMVINARTDAYFRKVGDERSRFDQTVARGNAYREAGADCVFVPGGFEHRETIGALAREIAAPLNVVANPAISVPVVPSIPELQDLGVARVSLGSGALRTVLALVARIGREVLGPGTYDVMKGELSGADAAEAYAMAIRPPGPPG